MSRRFSYAKQGKIVTALKQLNDEYRKGEISLKQWLDSKSVLGQAFRKN